MKIDTGLPPLFENIAEFNMKMDVGGANGVGKGDGLLTKAEWDKYVDSLGLSTEQETALKNSFDQIAVIGKDGKTITLDELNTMLDGRSFGEFANDVIAMANKSGSEELKLKDILP